MLGCHQCTERPRLRAPQTGPGRWSTVRSWGFILKARGSHGSAEPEKDPSGCFVGSWSEVRWELGAEASKGEQSWSHPTSLMTGFLS